VGFQPRRLKRDLSPPQFLVEYAGKPSNPVYALAAYLRACRDFGQPIVSILARVLAPDRRCFVEKAMGSSQLTARLKPHFEAVGVEYPVTTHGGRRGAIQALTGGGVPSAAAGELAQIRTPAVRVCYEDEYRHLPCPLARVGKGQKRGREDLA
jgi:hypothetical protein